MLTGQRWCRLSIFTGRVPSVQQIAQQQDTFHVLENKNTPEDLIISQGLVLGSLIILDVALEAEHSCVGAFVHIFGNIFYRLYGVTKFVVNVHFKDLRGAGSKVRFTYCQPPIFQRLW